MLKNSLGEIIIESHGIFPLLQFHRPTSTFICLGTGFFINESGWFVTAKHVWNGIIEADDILIGAYQSNNHNPISRLVEHAIIHPDADIAMGKLGRQMTNNGPNDFYEPVPTFGLSFNPININDDIMTFGYPRTPKAQEGTFTTFEFNGKWTAGQVREYLPNGGPLVKNRCYLNSMFVDTGVSGGPVVRNNYVIGINSTGYDLSDDSPEPLSFFTPIDYLLDFIVDFDDIKSVPFRRIVVDQFVRVEPSYIDNP